MNVTNISLAFAATLVALASATALITGLCVVLF